MKKKLLSSLSVCLLIILSACGPAAAPTLSLEDVEGTAFSIAYTNIALTQAAMPTATVAPPTNTPLPTLPPVPTLALIVPTIALPTAASSDPCSGVIPAKPIGEMSQIRFVNKTKSQVNLSFGMYEANEEGECGIYSFALSAYDPPTVTVLSGCYWGYAWINSKTPSIAESTSPICVDPGEIISVTIDVETIGID